jgi:hypothetical protein
MVKTIEHESKIEPRLIAPRLAVSGIRVRGIRRRGIRLRSENFPQQRFGGRELAFLDCVFSLRELRRLIDDQLAVMTDSSFRLDFNLGERARDQKNHNQRVGESLHAN